MKDVEWWVIVEERDIEDEPIYFFGNLRTYWLENDITLETTINTEYEDDWDYFIDFVSYPWDVRTDRQTYTHTWMLRKTNQWDLVWYVKVEWVKIELKFLKNQRYDKSNSSDFYYHIEQL